MSGTDGHGRMGREGNKGVMSWRNGQLSLGVRVVGAVDVITGVGVKELVYRRRADV